MSAAAQDAADLALALRAATAAGDLLLAHYSARQSLQVTSKRAGDFVSAADLEAETCLRDLILGAHPADGWLGEETAATGPDAGRIWIVDPLDGTSNFLRGIPHWAVSIALQVDGQRRIGVVHDPLKRETFAARAGAGASLNGAPIRVAQTARMQEALFGTGIPFGGMDFIPDHAADIARLMPHCAGVRRMGAAALDLAYVAAGRLDGFWERHLRPWDIAAGLVILTEAGASTGTLPGAAPAEVSGTVVTATPALYAPFAALLAGDGTSRA